MFIYVYRVVVKVRVIFIFVLSTIELAITTFNGFGLFVFNIPNILSGHCFSRPLTISSAHTEIFTSFFFITRFLTHYSLSRARTHTDKHLHTNTHTLVYKHVNTHTAHILRLSLK